MGIFFEDVLPLVNMSSNSSVYDVPINLNNSQDLKYQRIFATNIFLESLGISLAIDSSTPTPQSIITMENLLNTHRDQVMLRRSLRNFVTYVLLSTIIAAFFLYF